MPRVPGFIRRLLAVFTWNARERDMDREMAFHIDQLASEYVRGGMDAGEARRAAEARFGRVLRLKEQGHDIRTTRWLDDVVRDVRHMSRGLRKSPGFTITVVLTLTLGIGGNTAIFSIVDQLLLRPLPYPNGDELMTVSDYMPKLATRGSEPGRMRNSVSPANWMDWQRESRSFQNFAAWRAGSMTLTGVGEPARLDVQLVSWEFFPLLGVRPLHGRLLSAEDDRPNAPQVAILAHHLWQSRFGSDPSVVGRTVQINDAPMQIVGVMPEGFQFLDQEVALWTAARLDRGRDWRATAGRFINVVGRRKTGVSVEAARAEMEGLAGRLAAAHAFNKDTTVVMFPLRQELTGRVRDSLWMLYGAVGVLLSIACFNVANLLLARAATRRPELAIRTSLGAGRGAIVRQLIVESVLLATAGGVLGILLAHGSLAALVAFAPPDLLWVSSLEVDLRVLLYTLGLSMATGLVVGLVPALLVAREPLLASMRANSARVTHAPRIRQVLVIGQFALTVMLLCGAGLLVRTMLALNDAETGVQSRDVLTMEVVVPGTRYPAERRVQFYREAVDALRALPGVDAAAAANSLAVIGDIRGDTGFHRLGEPERPMQELQMVVVRVVTPGLFRTLGVPMLRGREYTAADYANPTPGFVVNEALVKAFLRDIDPLSVSISVYMQQKNPHAPIIGVVRDINEGSVRNEAQPTVYYSHGQMAEAAMTMVIRTTRPAAVANVAVAAIHRLDPNLAVTKVRTFEGAIAESLARERLNALVSGGFALSGLLLAALGVYGLLAFLVTERTKEIGIRLALGEQRARLARSVVGGGLRLVAIGAVIGVAGSVVLLRSVQSLLFGVTPNDLATYAAVLGLLGVVATLASYVPARRATRIEPLVALRQD
jgi:putative ABC transport system permease protein